MNYKLLAVLGTAGAAVLGFAAGWVTAEKRLEAKYLELGEDEIREAKEYYEKYYKTFYKADEFSTPDGAAAVLLPEFSGDVSDADLERVVEKLREDDTPIAKRTKPATKTVKQNVFAQSGDEVDPAEWESYKASRTSKRPYVLSFDEWNESEEGFVQDSLTYYAKDDVLANDQDMPIDNVDGIVGLENLKLFGYMSGNKKTVYVRNERLNLDFEILFQEGSYKKIVAGMDDEDEDRPPKRVRKMPRED